MVVVRVKVQKLMHKREWRTMRFKCSQVCEKTISLIVDLVERKSWKNNAELPIFVIELSGLVDGLLEI